MIAKLSPHRIVEYARDMVSGIAEHEYVSAQAARDAFHRMRREYASSGFYAKLYVNGHCELTAATPAENE